MNYLHSTLTLSDALPEPYWSNTSSNSIIYKLIRESNQEVKDMVESLINGESITVPVFEDIVYSDIDVRNDSIWRFSPVYRLSQTIKLRTSWKYYVFNNDNSKY